MLHSNNSGPRYDAHVKAALCDAVNKNLSAVGSMTTDEKKKLLWGNKKKTTTEEAHPLTYLLS